LLNCGKNYLRQNDYTDGFKEGLIALAEKAGIYHLI
jgi:hypothetical protein